MQILIDYVLFILIVGSMLAILVWALRTAQNTLKPCKHTRRVERPNGLFADVANGPKTYHYLDFVCKDCGHVDFDPLSINT